MINLSAVVMRMLLTVALTAPAMAFAAEPAMIEGGKLVDLEGRTLYTFDKDSAGKSACNDQCAVNWPPLAAAADSAAQGKWTVVTRDDKTRQWAYAGKPLYTFKNDAKAGDIEGDGKGGVWHVAKP